MAFTLKNLTSLLNVAIQHKASDIHIRTNETPCLRLRGELVPIQTKLFTKEDMLDIVKILLADNPTKVEFNFKDEIDGAYSLSDICRIRYNIFSYFNQVGIVLRLINTKVPTLTELDMPKIIGRIALQKRGLILVTGATGAGKSTTLAGMIDHINENRASHIISIEDPIEYLHPQKHSRVSQREVGRDTEDFTAGLRAALRQDPDVISIGEMRDPITADIALKAAETGHTVFSTLHTTNTLTTIGRLISMFPTHEQPEVRKRLAENLYAIIGQRMLPGIGGRIVIAQEIMVTSTGIRDCISGKDDLNRIPNIISQGQGKSTNGGQTFDQHIMYLYQKGFIEKEVALDAVSSQADFIQKLIVE
ncbi:MAG: PilT/PilU family type 4a pilus ATPase [Bacteriovoracaceae bacterium]|nr:PilT/PilU family type 4a pilus ATPase [Bacteriovoracaceae bacterium]